MLEQTGADATGLKLELTESLLQSQVEETIGKMRLLRALGIRFSMDDFGTGYSSLSYLRELPVHALKIDRSFITNLLNEPESEAIVRSIIELARNLHLETVAEGVEDERAFDRLVSLGCDYAQGFAIARPMPAASMLPWLLDYGQPDGDPARRARRRAT